MVSGELKQEKKGNKGGELQDLTDTLQRLQAEFENYTKRVEKEKQDFGRFANASLVKELLPVLDSFDSAIDKIEKAENIEREHMVNGLKELKKHLMRVLEMEGLREMHCLGAEFNPAFHECMAKEHNVEKGDNIVVGVIQKGYFFNDKILRTAKVKINKKAEGD